MTILARTVSCGQCFLVPYNSTYTSAGRLQPTISAKGLAAKASPPCGSPSRTTREKGMHAGCTWRLEILRENRIHPCIPVISDVPCSQVSAKMAIKNESVSYVYEIGVLLVFIGAVCLLPPVITGVIVTLSRSRLVEPSGAATTVVASPHVH